MSRTLGEPILLPAVPTKSSLMGEDLRDETFESADLSPGEDVLPLSSGTTAVTGSGDNSVHSLGPNASLINHSINAARSFEVFLGRRYDPAEAEVLGDPSGE